MRALVKREKLTDLTKDKKGLPDLDSIWCFFFISSSLIIIHGEKEIVHFKIDGSWGIFKTKIPKNYAVSAIYIAIWELEMWYEYLLDKDQLEFKWYTC